MLMNSVCWFKMPLPVLDFTLVNLEKMSKLPIESGIIVSALLCKSNFISEVKFIIKSDIFLILLLCKSNFSSSFKLYNELLCLSKR